MSEMVERVARVLFPSWFDVNNKSFLQGDEMREHAYKTARDTIAAMREPTQEMQKKWNSDDEHTGFQESCPMCGGHLVGWRIMIDAALAGSKHD